MSDRPPMNGTWVTNDMCARRYGRLWNVLFMLVIPMLVAGLGAVGFAMIGASGASKAVEVHNARDQAQKEGMVKELQQLQVRSQRIEAKQDKIYETMVEIKRMNGGS